MQNSTQFAFSIMFILSLGLIWGILYKVYVKTTLEERQAKQQAARRSIQPPSESNPPDTPPSSPSEPNPPDTPPSSPPE